MIFRRRHGPTDAELSRRRAEQALAADRKKTESIKAETAGYKALADSLRDLRQRNHFAESIAHTFRGGR